LKIAVVGSQGVGKSTLIEEFVRRRPEYVIIPEIAREMLERAGGTVPSWFDFQLELLWRKIEAETEARVLGNVISDRTVVDNWAFAMYHRVFPEDLMSAFREMGIAYANDYYDLFVFLPVEDVPFARNRDAEMREGVDRLIRSVLPRLEPVTILTGALDERIDRLLSAMESV